MALSNRNISVLLMALLFVANPVLTGIAAAQTCAGHKCCCSLPKTPGHPPGGRTVEAGKHCCSSTAGETPCNLNHQSKPGIGLAVTQPVRLIPRGTDTGTQAGALFVLLDRTADHAVSNDFIVFRSLSPPTYLTNLTLIC